MLLVLIRSVDSLYFLKLDGTMAAPQTLSTTLLLLLVASMLQPLEAIFVGTILLPHGDFAYDPSFCVEGSKERQAADRIASGSRIAARWLLDQQPEIVLLTTPHGLQLDYDYGIYHGRQGSGEVMLGQDLMPSAKNSPCSSQYRSPYNVSLDRMELVDDIISDNLLQSLQPNYPVSAIYGPNEDTPMPLFWGEIIPLLILLQQSQQAISTQDLYQSFTLRALIWTFPHRRYTHSPEMVPELLAIGVEIMTWIEKRPERIAVIVSGDLSHTHLADGPYGYSNTSVLYDAAISTWMGYKTNNNPCHPSAEAALLESARSLQPSALSCGFTGYVLWHGMMQCTEYKSRFHSRLLGLGNVTYYGMCSGITEDTQPQKIRTKTTSRRLFEDT